METPSAEAVAADCPACGAPFSPRDGKTFCSRRCRRLAADRRRRALRRDLRQSARPDVATEAAEPTETRQCLVCSAPFSGRAGQVYCGRSCSAKANNTDRYIPAAAGPRLTQIERAMDLLRADPTLTGAQLFARAGIQHWASKRAREMLAAGQSPSLAALPAEAKPAPLAAVVARRAERKAAREVRGAVLAARLRRLYDQDARDAIAQAEFEAALQHVKSRREAARLEVASLERRLGVAGGEVDGEGDGDGAP